MFTLSDKDKKILLAFILIGILLLGAAFPFAVKLKNFEESQFQMLLGSLAIITLFLERGVEVFVASWRDPDADMIRSRKLVVMKEIEHFQADIKDLETEIEFLKQANQEFQNQETERKALIDAVNIKEKDICAIESDEIVYASGTKRFAMYFALGAGMIISAVGIRILGTLVEEFGPDMGNLQQMAFRLTDIALTGGLLAGGSEALHRLAALYNTFLDATIKKANKS